MKGFNEAQRKYDNMSPDDAPKHSHRLNTGSRAEEDEEDRKWAEKQSKKTGRYVYTEAECNALNALGW